MFIFAIYYNNSTQNFEIKNYRDKKKLTYDNTMWIRINEKNYAQKKSDQKNLIKEGDIFRFGKQIIKITKINLSKKTKKTGSLKETSKMQINNNLYKSNKSISERSSFLKQNTLYCRICLQEETEQNPFEPLICKCSAKMPAHIDCLVKWIKKKCELKKNQDCLLYYDLENLKCEVCQDKYPQFFYLDDKKISFLEFKFDEDKDFISIDVFDKKKNSLKGKFIIFPDLKNRDFSIGRNTKSSIHFDEPSVSRIHSFIKFENNNFFLYDKNSKYGTLKMMKDILNFGDIINEEIVVNNIMLKFHFFTKKKCVCGLKTKYFKLNSFSFNKLFLLNDLKENLIVEEKKIDSKIAFKKNDRVEKIIIEEEEKIKKNIRDKKLVSIEDFSKNLKENDNFSNLSLKREIDKKREEDKSFRDNFNFNVLQTERNYEESERKFFIKNETSFDYKEVVQKFNIPKIKSIESSKIFSSKFSLKKGTELNFDVSEKNSNFYEF